LNSIAQEAVEEGAVSETKKVLSAEDILAAQDREPVRVEVPEWGGVVLVKPMSAEEATIFTDLTGEDKKHSAVKVTALCVVDEAGKPLFTEDQARKLRSKSLAAFMRIQRVILKINGMTDEDAKTAKNA
jgi:hypothetical protein